MSDEFGSVQEATMHIRRADARWQAAVHAFDPYPDRLRRLAEAAEGERKALLFADLCNVRWKPQSDTRDLRLAFGLEPGNRIGPEDLWVKFDHALEQLGVALEGDGFVALAEVFAAMSAAAIELADAIELAEPIEETHPKRKTG